MEKILLAAPVLGRSGGIAVWSKAYLANFPNDEFQLVPVDITKKVKGVNTSITKRVYYGLKLMFDVLKRTKRTLNENPDIRIMHTTTSGDIGTLRDYYMVKLCHRRGLKCIMHCRYGCIPEDFRSKGFKGRLLRKTMRLYDNIWVLDSRSLNALKEDPILKNKVFLTPNSIPVPSTCEIQPKRYEKIAYIAHLIPTKGLYELTEAVVKSKLDIELLLVGPGEQEIVDKIQAIAGFKYGSKIKVLGRQPNDEAMKILQSVDIMALPTYYPWEGFPISILEAMSRGKLVISCPRAAIPDMLTASDGSKCGVLVKEKSTEDIEKALVWISEHKTECDEMCKKAYEKVRTAYDTTVVYNLYRKLYRDLLQ
ncbi:MAG: glycosyltransferase family 4 protein [Bacteroidales bacterium]|nr:glycosyltransferase family 4 protein [Bacteroidales bacterium]